MTDWDKVFIANQEAGNWYPDDDLPMSLIDKALITAVYLLSALVAIGLLSGIAGYLYQRFF